MKKQGQLGFFFLPNRFKVSVGHDSTSKNRSRLVSGLEHTRNMSRSQPLAWPGKVRSRYIS
jgi:hypothetical protein